jgi:hypothetical protein
MDLVFWLGADAEAAAAEAVGRAPEWDGCLIENQFFTALFVPEIDFTDPQSDE